MRLSAAMPDYNVIDVYPVLKFWTLDKLVTN